MNNLGNIFQVFPNIFNRPFISTILDTPLYQFSVYLAIGPELYIDGLVVIDRNNQQVVGRIGCKNILSHIFNKRYSEWQSSTAEQIMDKITNEGSEIIEIDTSIYKVIEFFRKTKLAFTPIVAKDKSIVAVLTIRDFLPIVKNKYNVKDTSISQISSNLTSIDKNTDILKTIDIMLRPGIRNIGITENRKESSNVIGFVNDRSILEFLLSYNGKQIMKDLEQMNPSNIMIGEHLKIYPIKEISQDESIDTAATLLTDIERPFLIIEGKDKIITPWDIVMKTWK